jgi:hypothetical protein
MERRKAITVAATTSLTLLAGALGIALNSGIVGASGDDHVGKLSPIATTPSPPLTAGVQRTTTSVTALPASGPAGHPPFTTAHMDDGDEHDVHHDR